MIPKEFKIWDCNTKKFRKGCHINLSGDTIWENGTHGTVFVIIQKTGLEDDDEDKVFEKDIILWEGNYYTVEYGHYGSVQGTNEFGFYLSSPKYNFKYVGGGKIAGNIFENTSLIMENR